MVKAGPGSHKSNKQSGNTNPKKEEEPSDYYSILGISRDAPIEEIKKAYKKMALKYHPDRGGDAEMFKKVSQAYSVLTDTEKRNIYDTYGEEGIKNGVSESENTYFDPFTIFGSLFGHDLSFGNMDDFGGYRYSPFATRERTSRKKRGSAKVEDHVVDLPCSLKELYCGGERNIRITHSVVCKLCQGKGFIKGQESKCRNCKGSGRKYRTYFDGFSTQRELSSCGVCSGTGHVVTAKNLCKECKGNKCITESKQVIVNIPAGAYSGYNLRLVGMGNEEVGAKTGDLVFVVVEQKNEKFVRKGDDLIMRLELTMAESLCGFSKVIEMLDGRKLSIIISKGTIIHSDEIKKVKDEGMPKMGYQYKGDLIVLFAVNYPQSISAEETDVIASVLKYKPELNDESDVCEMATLEDVDAEHYFRHNENNQQKECSSDQGVNEPSSSGDYNNFGGDTNNCYTDDFDDSRCCIF